MMKQDCAKSLCQYVANGSANEAVMILRDAGFIEKPPQSKQEIAQALYRMIDQEGDPGLIKMAYIHPDKDLILEKCKQNETSFAPTTTGWPLHTYAADGKDNEGQPLDEKTNRLLIMAGAVIIATGLVTVILTSNQ